VSGSGVEVSGAEVAVELEWRMRQGVGEGAG
jgi:hypothetical protein